MAPPDLSIFRNGVFVRYFLARILFVFGMQVQMLAMLWQMPKLVVAVGGSVSDAAWAIGFTGLAEFVPLLVLSLFGGQIADRYDRKSILVLCFAAKTALTLVLCAASFVATQHALIAIIYVTSALTGAVNAFQPAAQQALLPSLVSKDDLPRAIPLSSLAFTISSVAGPGLGGVIVGFGGAYGFELAYAAAALMTGAGMLAIASVKAPRSTRVDTRPTLELVREGLAYVWNNKIVLGAISLDLMVVFLAGAQAIIPLFAARVLHADAGGAGLLRGAFAFGAAATALAIAVFPLRRHVGAWMFGATIVFALGTVTFGLSNLFWLSMLALFIAGAADMVSVQVRQSLIQLATPNEMLGRVAAVSFVFISASNELGDFEAGASAALLGLQLSVVVGGLAGLAAALLWMPLFPALRKVDTYADQTLAVAREKTEAPATTGAAT